MLLLQSRRRLLFCIVLRNTSDVAVALQALQCGMFYDDMIYASGTSTRELIKSIGRGNAVVLPFLSTAKSTQNHIFCWNYLIL